MRIAQCDFVMLLCTDMTGQGAIGSYVMPPAVDMGPSEVLLTSYNPVAPCPIWIRMQQLSPDGELYRKAAAPWSCSSANVVAVHFSNLVPPHNSTWPSGYLLKVKSTFNSGLFILESQRAYHALTGEWKGDQRWCSFACWHRQRVFNPESDPWRAAKMAPPVPLALLYWDRFVLSAEPSADAFQE